MKRALLGTISVGNRKYKGKCTVSLDRLRKPLEGPGDGVNTIMHKFCEGCGYVSEIIKTRALEIAKKAGITLPSAEKLHTYDSDTGEKIPNYFFRVKHCDDCCEELSGIELRPQINFSSN